MQQFLHYFFNFSVLEGYWPDILWAFLVTVEMSILVVILGTILGLLIAIARSYQVKLLNLFIVFYVDLFRAVPQLVLIVLVYYLLPRFHLSIGAFEATVVALTLVLSSFSEEIFWASMNAVPNGQWEAGRSTGLNFTQTMMSVVLSQAIRMSIPPLTNRAIAISKATTLGSVIAVPELLNTTSSIQSQVANPSALTIGAALFLALFFPFVRFTRWLEKAYSAPY